MTPEQMKELAEKVIGALNASPEFSDVALLEFEPPQGLPISFVHDGEDFVLELNVM